MELGFLAFPLVGALAAFGFAVITDTRAVHIDHINVPPIVADATGYTSDVLVARLVDEIHEIEFQAKSHAEGRDVEMSEESSPVAVLGEFFEIAPLIRVVQETTGLIPFSFSGEVVTSDNEVELVLRGSDSNHHSYRISQKAPKGQLALLIHKAAAETMRIIDPYMLAAYQFKRDFLTRDFAPTLEIIRRELDNSDSAHHKWMNNLNGIVRYQQGDLDGAIEAFSAAVHDDLSFGSARLNWGVVLARQGFHEHAIELFRSVVNLRNESPSTKAAALSEWGFSLALLDRFDEAFAKFHEATDIDPHFADVYTSWAEVLSVLGRKQEAEQKSAQALRLAHGEVVYTENLIGRVQSRPATAIIN